MGDLAQIVTPGTLSGGGVLALIAWGVWRQFKKDRADDRLVDAESRFRDDLLEALNAANERADRFAKERNEALMKLAPLEQENAALRRRVAELEGGAEV